MRMGSPETSRSQAGGFALRFRGRFSPCRPPNQQCHTPPPYSPRPLPFLLGTLFAHLAPAAHDLCSDTDLPPLLTQEALARALGAFLLAVEPVWWPVPGVYGFIQGRGPGSHLFAFSGPGIKVFSEQLLEGGGGGKAGDGHGGGHSLG